MWKKLVDYYKIPESASEPSTDNARFKRIRLISFLTATLGYGMYYVCRLSMNVIRKPMVEDGIFTETEIGVIGSCLFFTYAIGKFCNGFIADRSNVKRLMSTADFCIDQLSTWFYQLVLVVCHTLGNQWIFPVNGSSFWRSIFIKMV